MALDTFVEMLPEDAREAYKAEIASAVLIKSREDADKYLAEHPHLKSARDAVISRTTASYEEKFRTEKLPGLVEEEYRKKNPPKDPKDAALEEVKSELAKMKREAILKDRKATATAKLAELGLPLELADFALDEDEGIFGSKIERLAGLKAWRDAEVAKELGKTLGNQGNPNAGRAPEAGSLEKKYNEAMARGDIATAMLIKEQMASQ